MYSPGGRLIGDDYSIKAYNGTAARLADDMEMCLNGVQYDTIVVQGLSGVVFGARVAERLGKNLTIIRKPDDRSHHSDANEEGYLGSDWVFADDFMCAGTTVRRVWRWMAEWHPETTFRGIYEYTSMTGDMGEFTPASDITEDSLRSGVRLLAAEIMHHNDQAAYEAQQVIL